MVITAKPAGLQYIDLVSSVKKAPKYSSKDNYLDLTITEINPVRTEIFRYTFGDDNAT